MSRANHNGNLKGFQSLIDILSPDGGKGAGASPHLLMERMKSPVGNEGLTAFGRYLKENLDDPNDLEILRWVAFHFDVPAQIFNDREAETRNWVAIFKKDQEDVDRIHSGTITEQADLSNIYAPSLLASRIAHVCPDKAEVLRKKMWLYRSMVGKEICPFPAEGVCFHPDMGEMDLICFSEGALPDGSSAICISACNDETLNILEGMTTLGQLLEEPESASVEKFRNFGYFIFDVPENKGPLKSTFYARVPMFFHGTEQSYMSEVFVAFMIPDEESGKVVSLLSQILPAIKAAVVLINSQVAYAVGDLSRRYEMANLLHAVLRHDMKNLGEGVAGSVDQMIRWWEHLSSDPDKIMSYLKEIRANTTLAMMATELDYLWDTGQAGQRDKEAINKYKKLLDRAWQYMDIDVCEFSGNWDSKELIPRVCRVVFSNLVRNAVEETRNKKIKMDCRLEGNFVSFGVLSQKRFPEEIKNRVFEKPLSLRIPSEQRGLWICRYIVETLLSGKIFMAEGTEEYRTHIRFEFPISQQGA